MKISDMLKQVNHIVGNGNYLYSAVEGYFDECIDEINAGLYSELPLISKVYANDFDLNDTESAENYTNNSLENDYTRIPDAYIRNYICYEVAYRKLRDEDEAYEVYILKQQYAAKWFQRLLSEYSNFKLEDTEAISVNGDADEVEGVTPDNEYTNPYW